MGWPEYSGLSGCLALAIIQSSGHKDTRISNGDGLDILDRVDLWLSSQWNDEDTRIEVSKGMAGICWILETTSTP